MFAWMWLHPRVAALALVALLVAFAVTYKQGYDTGKEHVQLDWDKERLAVKEQIEKEKEQDRKAAAEASDRFEAKAREMERLNAEQSQQLQVALNRRFVCPKGANATIGDLIIPADVARGMFYNNPSASSPQASAPARKPRAGLFNWPRASN